jgi:hypothetical protein
VLEPDLPVTKVVVLQPEPEVKPSDTDVLTIFHHGANAHGNLAANWSTGCWTAVNCSTDRRQVISLSLLSLDLWGPLDLLSHLSELCVLDLHDIPNLMLLYLSHNNISNTVVSLTHVIFVNITDNSLCGLFLDKRATP